MSQRDFVLTQLRTQGSISRNFCLQNFISRLSVIIFNLESEGWEIEGEWIKTGYGKDFVYKLRPKQPTLL